MFWPLTSVLATFLVSAALAKIPVPNPRQAHLIMTAWVEQPAYETRAERELLELANRARAQAGVTALRMDEGLTRAAREHATAMAERRELSHQFAGEPELSQRLA